MRPAVRSPWGREGAHRPPSSPHSPSPSPPSSQPPRAGHSPYASLEERAGDGTPYNYQQGPLFCLHSLLGGGAAAHPRTDALNTNPTSSYRPSWATPSWATAGCWAGPGVEQDPRPPSKKSPLPSLSLFPANSSRANIPLSSCSCAPPMSDGPSGSAGAGAPPRGVPNHTCGRRAWTPWIFRALPPSTLQSHAPLTAAFPTSPAPAV
jgi:hypothetical protein